jgi:membrane associated rhomboid family serine protease
MANRGTQQTSSLVLVTSWLAILWLVFVADVVLHALGFSLANWIGLRPRDLHGLWGILGCHLLHADIHHLASNSLGLLILGLVSCWYSQGLTGLAIVISALVSASLTWLIAPAGTIHIGASGVIFGLVGFLVCNGLFRRSWGAFLLAVPVAVLLSGLVPGMLPTDANKTRLISWQMHLGGFLGGALASWQLRRQKGS